MATSTDLGWSLGVLFRDWQRSTSEAVGTLPHGPRGFQILEALDLTYDHLILDLGRIGGDTAFAELLASADAIVLAADGAGNDPQTAKVRERLTIAGLASVRVLAVDDGEVKSHADVAA